MVISVSPSITSRAGRGRRHHRKHGHALATLLDPFRNDSETLDGTIGQAVIGRFVNRYGLPSKKRQDPFVEFREIR